MSCVTHKKMYATLELAEEALIAAHTKFHYSPAKGPIAVYRCDVCGQYHLTSQGSINPRLARYHAEGRINLQREADHWADKIKRRD
jgi:ABC-type ATPase with predicted acetyltransferase domain